MYKPKGAGHEASKFNPKGNKEDAIAAISSALEKTVSGRGLEMKTNYSVPFDFKIDPVTHKPYRPNPNDTSCVVDVCIGKKVEDSDILIPRICIEVRKEIITSEFASIAAKLSKVKHNYDFSRTGIFAFESSNVDKDALKTSYLNSFDFVYALGDFIESPDKLEHYLAKLVEEQNDVSERLLDILHKDGEITYIRTNMVF